VDNSPFVTVELYSINGQLLNVIFEDKVKSGVNRLSFRVNDLPNGAYFLKIKSEEKYLHTEKIVVAH
jgi:hypothetical protein